MASWDYVIDLNEKLQKDGFTSAVIVTQKRTHNSKFFNNKHFFNIKNLDEAYELIKELRKTADEIEKEVSGEEGDDEELSLV